MSATLPVNDETVTTTPSRSIMPPYLTLRDFFPAETVVALLQFVTAHEADFVPTSTGRGDKAGVRPDVRVSFGMRHLGPFEAKFRDELRVLVPDLLKQLHMMPLGDTEFELELIAHNDGAFFKPHIDTQTASEKDNIRVLSGVYYFHRTPKAFSGGALRLYAIGDSDKKTFADIDPTHNTLLVFPSWAPHEVRPVACPSKRFADSRFAVNCWVRRAAKG
jgi:hypothetical protein